MSNTEAHAEANDSLARNEILTDNEIIRTIIEKDDDHNDVTPVHPVKNSHSEAVVVLNTSLHYSGLKSKILKHTKICSSDI
ncbi:hypothetical protein AVEN_17233-1 [Araneus ventricosus]|uniref:Uncharacterized protein n=1 Tax=Araneus ventricosus TaxID=182803 RepID=A0A4Y2FMG0_ARAVE|nr:hypothetical protein AVEN_17233-1 [Araneus ventricosus]